MIVAASASAAILSLLAWVDAKAKIRLLQEQVGRAVEVSSSNMCMLDSDRARSVEMFTDLSKAIVVVDRRVQRTLLDPILALDETGQLVIWDGPNIAPGDINLGPGEDHDEIA
jgi:hypothetical protein